MNRRQLLATVATSTVLAGCQSFTDETSPTPTETESQPTPTTPQETETPNTPENSALSFQPESVYKDITLGDRENVHDYYASQAVEIWNADEEAPRDFTVTIESQSTTMLDETYSVPGDTSVRVELPEPATYTINIGYPAEDSETTRTIEEQDYDCNGRDHCVKMNPDGRIETIVVTSTTECGTPPEDA